MDGFSVWPRPAITEEEQKAVSLYRTVLPDGKVMPGVLRRIYPFTLINTTVPGEQSVLTIRYVTSGLRSLLFGITFSADIEFWQVALRTLSGEILFDTGPVAALLNLPKQNGSAAATDAGLIATAATWNLTTQRVPGLPLIFDPPWVLDGTQALQLDGSPLPDSAAQGTYGGVNTRGVLNVAFHVWELPGAQGERGPTPPPPTMPMRARMPPRMAPRPIGGR